MLEGGTGWMCKYNQGEVVEGGDGFWFMFSKYALERMKIYEIGV